MPPCESTAGEISIHAPLTGSDFMLFSSLTLLRDFNPRSPYGERLLRQKIACRKKQFQSTLPLRGATRIKIVEFYHIIISIHAPLTGSDLTAPGWRGGSSTFQSTLPLRGATKATLTLAVDTVISIHAPLTGSDWRYTPIFHHPAISIHAPLTGSDQILRCQIR